VNSLRHIKPRDDEERQWQWKEGSTIRLQNPDSEDELLTHDAGRADFDITGTFRIERNYKLIRQSNYSSFLEEKVMLSQGSGLPTMH
jgi:hypothetical protein